MMTAATQLRKGVVGHRERLSQRYMDPLTHCSMGDLGDIWGNQERKHPRPDHIPRQGGITNGMILLMWLVVICCALWVYNRIIIRVSGVRVPEAPPQIS